MRHQANRRLRFFSAMLVVLFSAAACTSSSTESPNASGGSSEPEGEQTTLVVGTNTLGEQQFDPPLACSDNQKVMLLNSDSLIDLNKETRLMEGSIAESYELSEDGLTWTFRLRPDVQFHDGWGTVTAEDVKFTWEQWISEESCHNAKLEMTRAVDGDMDNFEIVSDLEFRLHGAESTPGLLGTLCACDSRMWILSKRYFEEMGDVAKTHPIGTGPWQFVSSTPGVEVVFEAFDEYWAGAPGYDRMVLKLISDGAARMAQVQSGDVDLALLDAELLSEAEAVGLDIPVVEDTGNAYVVLGGSWWGHPAIDSDAPWIQEDDPEAGLAVREALSLAVDRELILETIVGGYGDLTHAIINQYPSNPRLVDPSWTLPEYDVDAARQRLADGGYPDGFPITIFLYQQDINTVGIGQAVAGMWEAIGLDVTLEPIEEDYLEEQLVNKTATGAAWVNIQSFKPTVELALWQYRNVEDYDTHLMHPVIDDAYARIVPVQDAEEQYAIGREVLTVLRDEMIGIPLFTTDMLFVAGPDVHNWSPTPGVNTFSKLETITPTE